LKRLLIVVFAVGSISNFAFAENFDGVVCGDGSGSFIRGRHYSGDSEPLRAATRRLQDIIDSFPNKGAAAFSSYLNLYVEVTNKLVSKVDIESLTIPNDPITEYQASACATISLSYSKCEKISYDSSTGGKIVKCPSGAIIKD
jgi:hypothetical protein